MGIFKKKRKKDTSGIEEKDYEDMLIRHRRRVGIGILILLLLAVVLAFCVKIFLDHREYENYEIADTTDMGDVSKCEFYRYCDGILRYSNDGISYMVGDDTIWNQAFEMKDPVIDICEKYMAIADLHGSKIYIYNNSGQQGEIETTAPILSLEVASQGVVAAITKNDTANLIEVYDKEGTNIAVGQTVLSGDGSPLSISISNDGTKLAVSYVYLESSVAKTKVVFYNYSEVGKNEVGRIVGAFEHYDTSIISKVEFVTNDVVAAFGDDILTIYSIKQRPSVLQEFKLDKAVESVVYNEQYIGIICKSDLALNQHIVTIYDINGKSVLNKTIDFAYTDVQLAGDRLIFNNQTQLYIFTVDNILKYNGTIKDGIVKVIPSKYENRYTVITNNEAQEIKLK
ncbi:MAG: DUF5711 family protein [Lachnospiraceae bacterium]|nr:DUF5711 family protein [Lachnospiraceae bacterium]